ncbi:MAG TPA: FtsQ-type POTRA domain-containing protein [Firmicutes bacterium]|nr:FtsQ-type POTRA domain-containing protein [Bacillota bacterium]
MLLGSCFAFVSDAIFTCRNVAIEGNSLVSREEVLAASGLRPGMNLLTVVPPLVRNRLLRLPAIKEATVELKLPDTIRIALKERNKFALYNSGGKFFFLDEVGTVLGQTRADASLPIVSYVGEEVVRIGDQPPPAVNGLRVIRATAELAPRISEVSCDASYGMRLFLREGTCVELGQADSSLESRCRTAVEVINHLKDLSTVKKIDVRFSKPVITGVIP